MAEPKKHSRWSASGSKRWLECPGSVAAEEKCPPSEDNEYSLQGSAAHELMEVAFKKLVSPKRIPLKLIEKKYQRFIDDEMRGHVEAFQDIVLERANGADLWIETSLDLSHIHPEMFGTNDIGFSQPFGDADIFDLKYGRGVQVDAEGNSQLAFYGIGFAQKIHWDFDKMNLHIFQPRVHDELQTWTATEKDLREWERIFREGVKRTLDKNAPLVAGDWCRFCRAKPTCPAMRSLVAEQTTLDFEDAKPARKLPDPKTLTPEKLAGVLEHKALLEGWLESVATHATTLLQSGGTIPGWKLVNRRPTRVWKDDTVEARAKKLFGADIYEVKFKSPAKLEKIKKAKLFVKSNTVSVSKGVVIAKENDKRPQLLMGPNQEFGEDDE